MDTQPCCQSFDFASLIAFIIGIFLGCALLALIYSILVVSSIKSKKYVVTAANLDVTDEEVKEIIDNAKAQFKDKNLKGSKGYQAYLFPPSHPILILN